MGRPIHCPIRCKIARYGKETSKRPSPVGCDRRGATTARNRGRSGNDLPRLPRASGPGFHGEGRHRWIPYLTGGPPGAPASENVRRGAKTDQRRAEGAVGEGQGWKEKV